MTAESGSGQWLVQLLGLGIGWFVVHHLSAKRDQDKARKDLIVKSVDSLYEGMNTLLADARTYHTSDRSIGSELKLKIALQDLLMRLNGLSDLGVTIDQLAPCRKSLGRARQAITGLHFEDEHEGSISENSPQVQDICDVILKTKRELLNIKHRQFKSS